MYTYVTCKGETQIFVLCIVYCRNENVHMLTSGTTSYQSSLSFEINLHFNAVDLHVVNERIKIKVYTLLIYLTRYPWTLQCLT